MVWKAKRNGGIHEPEARLILLIPVTAVCITMLMIYGMVCDEPEKYSSWGIVFGKQSPVSASPVDIGLISYSLECLSMGFYQHVDYHDNVRVRS